ncbi:MAG: GNAT family N-acetyltransferase, partial [Ornithinimicrobium sp.]
MKPSPRPLRSTGLRDVAHPESAVNRLLRQTGAPITARPSWWTSWAQAFGHDPLLLCPDDHRALAPLATQRRHGHTKVQLLGGESSDQARLPALDHNSARTLADLINTTLAEHPRWHVQLHHLPPGDPVTQRLAEILPHHQWSLPPDRASPFIALRPGTGIEDYLSRSWRKTHRRTAREFERAGGVVRHTREADEISQLLPNLSQIRRARDHRCARVSDLDTVPGYRFWASIILDHARRGEAEVATATVDGELLAYDVILLDRDIDRLWDGRVSAPGEALSLGRHLQD